jgi:hypothetical protein
MSLQMLIVQVVSALEEFVALFNPYWNKAVGSNFPSKLTEYMSSKVLNKTGEFHQHPSKILPLIGANMISVKLQKA